MSGVGVQIVSIMRILILFVAGAAALIAAMMVRNMSNQPPPKVVEVLDNRPVEPQIKLTKVLIAKKDYPVGHRLAPEDFVWKEWPAEGLDERYLTDEKAPDSPADFAGGIVRIPFFAGEPILDQKVIKPGEKGIMAAMLEEGMRAVAVEISVETAAGGFILPNDRVDVILSYKVEVTDGDVVVERPATRTVLKNVRVLAIDQSFREVEGEDVVVGTTATLELSPSHAEVLMLANQMGDISLTLRGVKDASAAGTKVEATSSLQSAKDVSGTIKIYRSGKVEKTTVGGDQ